MKEKLKSIFSDLTVFFFVFGLLGWLSFFWFYKTNDQGVLGDSIIKTCVDMGGTAQWMAFGPGCSSQKTGENFKCHVEICLIENNN